MGGLIIRGGRASAWLDRPAGVVGGDQPAKGQIELFAVCTENERIYAVPIEDATRSEGRLGIEPTGNHQDKRVRWARDYELPE